MIKAALAMGLCVAMRPTSIMLWMMLALVYLQVRGGECSSSRSSSSIIRAPPPPQTQPEATVSDAVMMLLKITLPIGVAGMVKPSSQNLYPLIFVFGTAVNVVNVVIDRICYGYWVIPAWNFVRFDSTFKSLEL